MGSVHFTDGMLAQSTAGSWRTVFRGTAGIAGSQLSGTSFGTRSSTLYLTGRFLLWCVGCTVAVDYCSAVAGMRRYDIPEGLDELH